MIENQFNKILEKVETYGFQMFNKNIETIDYKAIIKNYNMLLTFDEHIAIPSISNAVENINSQLMKSVE